MRLALSIVATMVLSGIVAPGCRNDRPVECQKLRQCCDAAKSLNLDAEAVRVACTRKEDNDAVLCERRLSEVTASMPTLVDREECRLPSK